jgi:mannan endo-1,4-beta-mannosidase
MTRTEHAHVVRATRNSQFTSESAVTRPCTRRGNGKHLAAAAVILGLAALCVAAGSRAPLPARPTAGATAATTVNATQYATASSLKWGLWEPAWQLSNGGVDNTVFTHMESELNHHTDIIQWFAGWSESWAWYDSGLLQQAVKSGRTPMVTWEPTGISLQSITSGAQDAYIDSWAKGMAATSASTPTIYLRIFHEFNDPLASGSGYGWGVNGGTSNRPADLVAAWRHVHDRFVAAGATNVKFVWAPDGVNFSSSLLAASYPGDAYVDLAGFDDYGYNTLQDYQTIGQITQKPLLLSEISSQDPQWVNGLASQLNTHQMPRLQGVVWFDEGVWRLDSLLQVFPAVTAMLAGAAFNPPAPCTTTFAATRPA